MDHQFISTPSDNINQGPGQYLSFHLHHRQQDPGSGAEISAISHAFFTLKECLCAMLLTPLASLDPGTAAFTREGRYQHVDITDFSDQIKRASLVAIRPGLPHESEASPGIYLFISRYLGGPELVRQITGIPLPATENLDHPFLIPLATYGPNLTSLEVTPAYLDLYHYAQTYLQQLQRQRAPFTHQLVFKGTTWTADTTATPTGKPYHLTHHYYDNAHEPVKALLGANLYLYDALCDSNTLADRHQHAFVLDQDHTCIAAIKALPIDQAISGPPFAGIYLQAHPDIAALEIFSQLRLNATPENMRGGTDLLLSAYHYNHGYFMVADQHAAGGEALFHFEVSGSRLPDSPYAVSLFYVADEDPYVQQPFGHVNEQYHFSDIRKALQWLLQTDFSLLSALPQPRQMVGFNLSSAGIYDDQSAPIVSLRRVAHHPSRIENGVILLEFHRPGQLPQEVVSAIAGLEGCQPLTGAAAGAFCLVLGHVAPTGVTVLNTPILSAIQRISQAPTSMAAGQQIIPVLTRTEGDPPEKLTIELQWRLPGSASQDPQPPPEELTVMGLDSAHQVLLALDREIFQGAELWRDTIWLERARLLHGESKAEIASRFYLSGQQPEQMPGHFIAYNIGLPQGEKLALRQAHLDMLLVPVNPYTATYMLSPPLALPAPAPHPRVMSPPQEGHPRQKL